MKHKKSVLKILSASCDYFDVSHGMAGNVSGIYEVGEFGKLQLQLPTEDK